VRKEHKNLCFIEFVLGSFTMCKVLNYFVEVVAAYEVARRDFKSLSEMSYQLFKAGH